MAEVRVGANYTDKQVLHMVTAYVKNPCRYTVDMLAEDLDKSVKSIIGKLSREGVYKKAIYKTKAGEVPVTKVQLIHDLATLLEIDVNKIIGLEKAPKQDIKFLHDLISLGGESE